MWVRPYRKITVCWWLYMKRARWGGPPCPPARGGQGRPLHQRQPFFIFRCVRKEMIVGIRLYFAGIVDAPAACGRSGMAHTAALMIAQFPSPFYRINTAAATAVTHFPLIPPATEATYLGKTCVLPRYIYILLRRGPAPVYFKALGGSIELGRLVANPILNFVIFLP